MSQEILDKVMRFLAPHQKDPQRPFTASSRLRQRGFIDSLALVQLVVFLEQEFGLRLEPKDLDRLETPAAIVDLIESKFQK